MILWRPHFRVCLIFHSAWLRLNVCWTFSSWPTSSQYEFFSLLENMFHRRSLQVFFFFNAQVFASCLCAPFLLRAGSWLARIVQDKINISVGAVTGNKYVKAYPFALISYHSTGFLSRVCPLLIVIFDPWIEPYHVLTFQIRVELGVIAMKGCSLFSKDQGLKPHHHMLINKRIYTNI